MINRILIVNDSHMERAIAKEQLSRVYMVFEAESGEDAFEILDREQVDIIFLDNVMKNETGYDIAKKLRKDSKFDDVPLVLLSSNNNPINEIEAFESGFNAYLLKSNIKTQIIEVVRSFEQKELDKPIKVLVVDDSRIISTMLSYTFNKEGFNVKTADSGEKAIEILKDYKPDFITLDVEMPGMDGFQTAEIIRNNPETKNIPIIMITTVDTVESRIKGLECGVAEYFIKPFEPIKLTTYVKTVLIQLDNTDKNKTILIVSNSISTQHILEYTLNKNGFKTISINEVEKAFTIFNREKNLDLILIDFDSGEAPPSYKLCNELKIEVNKLNLKLSIIAITSLSNKLAIIDAFRNGADDYISKPFSEEELMIRIRTHINYKDNLNATSNNLYINKYFIDLLGHELRSPISSIIGTTQLLLSNKDKYGINNNGLKFVNNISNSSMSLLSQIDKFLKYIKFKTNNAELNLEKSYIDNLLKDSIEEVTLSATEKNIKINIENKIKVPPMKLDKSYIVYAFQYILEYCISYADKDSEISVIISSKNRELEISIKYYGLILEKDSYEKIFEPFHMEKKYIEHLSNKYSSFMLPVANEIIKSHKGRISIESFDKGSIIYILIKLK